MAFNSAILGSEGGGGASVRDGWFTVSEESGRVGMGGAAVDSAGGGGGDDGVVGTTAAGGSDSNGLLEGFAGGVVTLV